MCKCKWFTFTRDLQVVIQLLTLAHIHSGSDPTF
jgi:hypothetical protein